MPQRSTDFQRLIMLITRQVAPAGAKVTESKMLQCRLTGEEMEADIVIEHSVGPHPITIVLECREHTRPATKEWVREVYGKYRDVECNKRVLVSKAGFYKTAEALAIKLGMQPMTLRDAAKAEWPSMLDDLTGLEIEQSGVRFKRATYVVDKPVDHWGDVYEGPLRANGRVLAASMRALLDTLGVDDEFRQLTLEAAERIGKDDFYIHLKPEEGAFLENDLGDRVNVKEIVISVSVTRSTASLDLHVRQFGDARVAVGSGAVFGFQVAAAAVETPEGRVTQAIQMGTVVLERALKPADSPVRFPR